MAYARDTIYRLDKELMATVSGLEVYLWSDTYQSGSLCRRELK